MEKTSVTKYKYSHDELKELLGIKGRIVFVENYNSYFIFEVNEE